MKDFKNNGKIKLTPTEWLDKLANEFKKNEHYKDMSTSEILSCFCVQSFLDNYQEGQTPEEVAHNELTCE